MPDRYGHLVAEIERHRCGTILEVGTWDGEHALLMIEAALRHHEPAQVGYFGFDLFEEAILDDLQGEQAKLPPPLETVQGKLQPLADRGVAIHLTRGDSQRTLPEAVKLLPRIDCAFLDGGHSYETVRSDWEQVQKVIGPESVVLFDDCVVNPDAQIVLGTGVNAVVDGIDRRRYTVRPLRPVDVFPKDWGVLKIVLVKVTPRARPGP